MNIRFLTTTSSVPDFRVRLSLSAENSVGLRTAAELFFFDVARIIRQKHPKIVFMENVKNFASHDNGHTLEVVKGTLEELGYTFF